MIAPAGRKLGKYEIRQKLGRGGMADVYLAQDSEHGEMLALKLIEHSPDADTRDSIEAERRGAELQAQLAAVDPRVVRVYDCGRPRWLLLSSPWNISTARTLRSSCAADAWLRSSRPMWPRAWPRPWRTRTSSR